MPNTYTWTFSSLTAYPEYASQTDVVYTVHWTLTGTNPDGVTGSVYGTQALEYVAGSPFTPYAQLTEAQVQGWVVDAMGPTQVAALEANIDSQIQQQITPTSVNLPPPWSAQPAQG